MSTTTPPVSHETSFTRLAGCRLPIQSAPMPGIVQDATLPAAVAAAGGHGMLPATSMPRDRLERELDALDAVTRAYGVNFIALMLDRECLELAAERAPLVDVAFGEPDPGLVATIHEGGALTGWHVASRDEALAAVDAGCDFVGVQGVEAGGRPRAELGLLALLDEVLGAVDVPVIAAGGIGSALGAAAVLAAGASCVRCGTRFIASVESAAHPAYKQALVEARAGDSVLTQAFSAVDPIVTNHRVLRSSLRAAETFDGAVTGEVVVGDQRIAAPRFAGLPPTEGATGAIAAMPHYAGESVGGVTAVLPAGEIVAELASALSAPRAGTPGL